ncbi:MAG: phage tail protein [Erythrobacter sp.]|nr:phage tail protein [Erythrobacter sp.]
MKKPASLRAAIEAAIPEIRNERDRLKLWVEDGAVRARQTEKHGFAFEYPLSVLVEETATDIAIIVHAITRWIRINQPNLMAGGSGDSFSFETDILDNSTADILFTLKLTENVAVTPIEGGSWAIDYLAEPNPLFDDDVEVAAAVGRPPLAEASNDSIVAD